MEKSQTRLPFLDIMINKTGTEIIFVKIITFKVQNVYTKRLIFLHEFSFLVLHSKFC